MSATDFFSLDLSEQLRGTGTSSTAHSCSHLSEQNPATRQSYQFADSWALVQTSSISISGDGAQESACSKALLVMLGALEHADPPRDSADH